MQATFVFLHVLSAFMLLATVVIHSAYAFGATPDRAATLTADTLWNVGAGGTILLGVILAVAYDSYSLISFWIIAAIVLWAAAGEVGRRAQVGFAAGDAASLRSARSFHWIRTAAILAILVLMVWKPGA